MTMWARLRSWTAAMLGRSRMERDMDEEMRFHIEAYAAELMQRGVPQQEALRQARLEFGGMETAKEECRDAVGVSFLETLFQDMRHGIRTMQRTPVFTVIAATVLALGIGANTAIFSVVDAVLLRPLDYKDSGRLVTVLMNGDAPVAPANYIDWRDQNRSFEAMGAADYWSPNLTGLDSPEHLVGLKVTQNLFPMLGIDPLTRAPVHTRGGQRRRRPRSDSQLPALAAQIFGRPQRAWEADRAGRECIHDCRGNAAGISVRSFLGHESGVVGAECVWSPDSQSGRQ